MLEGDYAWIGLKGGGGGGDSCWESALLRSLSSNSLLYLPPHVTRAQNTTKPAATESQQKKRATPAMPGHTINTLHRELTLCGTRRSHRSSLESSSLGQTK
jgi:hypothetical protein